MTRPSRLLAGAAVAMLVAASTAMVSGCSAAPGFAPPPTTATTSAIVTTAPAGGVLLTEVGFPDNPRFFTHAPAGFSIPAGVQPVGGANLTKLINVIFDAADGPAVHAYLSDNLVAMGCTVTASSADSIVWQQGAWDGAFTMTATQAAVSLRLTQ